MLVFQHSQMHAGGRVDSFRSLYESVCIFQLLCGLATSEPDWSLLVQKLVECTDIFVDVSGKSFWEVYRNHPHLAVHAYRDLQHILSAFVVVATNSTLSKSVESGNQVALGNCSTVLAVANGHIHNLRAVVNGNGLGSFLDALHCLAWFAHSPSATHSAPNTCGTADRRAPDASRAAPRRATPADLAKVTEQLRTLGSLKFDASVSGAKPDLLDKVPVRAKKWGSRVAKRLCMRFLTKGFACSDTKCKGPHVPNLNTLPETDRKKVVDFCGKTPRLVLGTWTNPRWHALGLQFDRFLLSLVLKILLTTFYHLVTIPTLLCPDLSAPFCAPCARPETDEPSPSTDPLFSTGFLVLVIGPHLPDDEVPDTELDCGQVEQRADERYPTCSLITLAEGTVRAVFNQAAQWEFRHDLDAVDPWITAKIDQPFGKGNLLQTFVSEAAFRHVLLPLWKSGYLYDDDSSWDALCSAYYPASLLRDLLSDYGNVSFAEARGFNPTWDVETKINQDRVAAMTAAFLHFNGSVADLVRWVGGPRVVAQQDHRTTMECLQLAGVDERVCRDLHHIFYHGIPALCQAEATEENFAAYYKHGNHSTVNDKPEKTHQTMVKDARKGFTLLLDERATLLMLHCHLTPQGVVDLNIPHKNPRPIFDSSFWPEPWCWAIND